MRVNNIKPGNYEGYIWRSNDQRPKPIEGDFKEDLTVKNPFVIEGQLYDKAKRVSYSIKFVDGEYIIKEYRLDDLKDADYTEQTFYANRRDDKRLLFYQYWKEEPDGLCEGMKVLQPAELVFVGFKNKEE